MNRLLFFFSLFFFCFASGSGTQHVVTNSGFTFAPDTITINLGDTVAFILGGTHSAREVTKATWDANDSASDGGFNTPLGGGMVVPAQTGIFYYVCRNHFAMGMKGTITVSPVTGVVENPGEPPPDFVLTQNSPNPFNPTTSIRYALPVQSKVTLIVYNLLGQSVQVMVDDIENAGYYRVEWNAGELPSGIYFYRLQATDVLEHGELFTSVRKMLLLK